MPMLLSEEIRLKFGLNKKEAGIFLCVSTEKLRMQAHVRGVVRRVPCRWSMFGA